jgi:hypothetical protein
MRRSNRPFWPLCTSSKNKSVDENMMRLRKLGSNAKLQAGKARTARKAPMQEIAYYVILFRRQDGDLLGMAPIKAESEIAAVGEALHHPTERSLAMSCCRFPRWPRSSHERRNGAKTE